MSSSRAAPRILPRVVSGQLALQLETAWHRIECRNVVAQRICVRKLQVAANPSRSPEVAVFHRFAKIATRYPAQPATQDAP